MIHIRLYLRDETALSIQIRGHHEGGIVGERACIGISVLSRVLLHALGMAGDPMQLLKWGSFDIALDERRKSQEAAHYTITGYRMIARGAAGHVRIQTIQVNHDGDDNGASEMSSDD